MAFYESGVIGLLLGLLLGFITILLFYFFMLAENKKYAKKQKEMIENLAKLIDKMGKGRI